MAAHKTKLAIDQGATFIKEYVCRDDTGALIDLTGCTARAQVRAEVASPSVLLEMTTENGKIALGGTAGTITITLSDTETSALSWSAGEFDMEVVFPGGRVTRFMRGTVSVSPEITR